MARGSVRPDDVTAVAVTSQWSGTVPIDRDGKPLHDAIIWMDARGADDVKRAAGGLRARAGLRAAQAAHVDQAHRRRARAVGQGPDRAHPVVPARRTPTSRARRGSTSSRRTGSTSSSRAGARRPTTRSCCTGSPTTATSPRIDYDPGLLRLFGVDRVAVPRSRRRATSVLGPLQRRRSRRELGRAGRHPRGRRHARPAVGRDRLGRGARLRGPPLRRHVVVADVPRARSRRPTSSTASRRCRRRCRASTTSPTSRRSRARASTGCATTCSSPATRSRAAPAPDDFYLAARRRRGDRAGRGATA